MLLFFPQPERFVNLGIEPPKGVLLFGPPGTGKTLCARAVANRTDACFIRVIGSELVQKYVGEVSGYFGVIYVYQNLFLICQHQVHVKRSSCEYEGRHVTRIEKIINHSRTGDQPWSDVVRVPPNF